MTIAQAKRALKRNPPPEGVTILVRPKFPKFTKLELQRIRRMLRGKP